MSRAYQLDALRRAGVTVAGLGCVMLDVNLPDMSDMSGVIADEWAYTSTNPDHWWITGVQTSGHVTLLYGLLPDLVDQAGVDEALDGWEQPAILHGRDFEVFESPFSDEPYSCIVARVDHPSLRDAHARLSLLPHINTYPEYKAHVTLAYVHRDYTEKAVTAIIHVLGGILEFKPTGLNYGGKIKESLS